MSAYIGYWLRMYVLTQIVLSYRKDENFSSKKMLWMDSKRMQLFYSSMSF